MSVAPALAQLRRYDRRWLRGDVVAGVTVAAYLVPQVMAYAELAGLPAVVGLWAIIGPLAVYAVLGTSPQLSVGPESTTALLTAVAVAPLAAGDPGRFAALAAALGVLVGIFCLVGWVARLGFLADLLSKPVLVGYMAGVAVMMIVGQLEKVTGAPVEGDSITGQVRSFLTNASQVRWPTLLLAAGVLAFLLLAGRRFPRAPVPLVGILLAVAVVAATGLRDAGIAVVGPVPEGLPVPRLPAVTASDLASLVLPALGVAIVGYTDNVLTARTFAVRNRYEIDANGELLALGTANVAAGLSQGMPVSSSASRTVIGDAVGSRSQLYSLVALGMVLATLFLLGPLLAAFPTAALGALVVFAALRLVDVAEFRRVARFRRSELVLALATTAGVLVLDILYGVLVAVGLSVLDLLRRVARPHDAVLGYPPGVPGMHDVDDYPDARQVPGLVVYRYDSPLFFANAEDFRRRALQAVDDAEPPVRWFVLNSEGNVEVDLTAVDALDDLRRELDRRGVVFAMARVKQDMRSHLGQEFLDGVGEHRIFMTLPTAVQAYVAWHTERFGRPPEGVTAPQPPPSPLG
ncbi:MAG: SulP family inorganic anion transporter [Actinomycetes bacterium]